MGPRLLAITLLLGAIAAKPFTPIHEAGRCAIRGNCGKSSFFSPELPCPDNGLAEEPDDDVRKQLVGICGSKWAEGNVCCKAEQVSLFVVQRREMQRI
jgi:Niemann-Pick C1 protein